MIEQISKRLGQEYIMFGTSMVYFCAQALTASLVQVLGYVMRKKTRFSSLVGIDLSIGIIFVSFFCCIVGEWKYNTAFRAVVREDYEDDVGASLGLSA